MDNKLKDLMTEDDPDSIPLADGDPSDVIEDCHHLSEDKRRELEWRRKMDFESLDSIPSISSDLGGAGGSGQLSEHMNRMCLDPDFSPDEQEEKARLISQVILFAEMRLNPLADFFYSAPDSMPNVPMPRFHLPNKAVIDGWMIELKLYWA